MPTRRQFLATSAALATLPLTSTAKAEEGTAKPSRPNRIAVSTYSFWRFLPDSKVKIEDCIRQSAAMGFDGVEILHRQMEGEENAYLQSLKKIAITEGVDLCGLS